MRVWRLLVLFALSIFAFGCGTSTTTQAGKERTKVVEKAVSLSPSVTELFAAVGGYEFLKGRTSSCNFPTIVSNLPVVAGVKPDYEKIRTIKPDLVVVDKSLYGEAEMAKIKGIGAEIFVIEAPTVDGFCDQLLQFGQKIAKEVDYSKYVDRINQAVEVAKASIPKSMKVAIILPSGSGSHLIAGTGSFQADVIKRIGCEPVGPPGDAFVPYNAESLLTQNPDFIVSGGDPSALLKDPRLASLEAIKSKRILPVIEDVLVRRGARVDKLIAAIGAAISGAKK